MQQRNNSLENGPRNATSIDCAETTQETIIVQIDRPMVATERYTRSKKVLNREGMEPDLNSSTRDLPPPREGRFRKMLDEMKGQSVDLL